MVFIVLGAVKAVKAAKIEYQKDKRRNALITPVEGSASMLRDRPSSSSTTNVGANDWWGATPTSQPPPQPVSSTITPQPNTIGAWSRNTIPDQRNHCEPPPPISAPSSTTASQSSATAAQPTPSHSNSSASSAAPPTIADVVAFAPAKKPVRSRPSTKRAPVQGSFEEVLSTRAQPSPVVQPTDPARQPATKARAQPVQPGAPPVHPPKPVDGSFEAALLAGAVAPTAVSRPQKAQTSAVASGSAGASATAARRPVRKLAEGGTQNVAQGSFEEAMLAKSRSNGAQERSPAAAERVVAGSFEAAMKAQMQTKNLGVRSTDMSTAANSKNPRGRVAKAEQVVAPVQSGDAAPAAAASGPVGSYYAEGSMKRSTLYRKNVA